MSKIIERIKSMFKEKDEIEDTNIKNIAENIAQNNENGNQSKSEIEAILNAGATPKLGVMKRPHTEVRITEEKEVNLNGQRVTFMLDEKDLSDSDER